jgi:hypothetical protein
MLYSVERFDRPRSRRVLRARVEAGVPVAVPAPTLFPSLESLTIQLGAVQVSNVSSSSRHSVLAFVLVLLAGSSETEFFAIGGLCCGCNLVLVGLSHSVTEIRGDSTRDRLQARLDSCVFNHQY